MHPYLMFQLIQEREKTMIVNITARNSLYQVINRLVKSGLAAVHSTERADNRPERTVYCITDAGRATVKDWLRQILAGGKPEYPEFPAALSLLPLVSPEEAIADLDERLARLDGQRAAIVTSLAHAGEIELPRLFVLDEEYRAAALAAEIGWVEGVLAELRGGSLTWSAEWIAEVAAKFEPVAE